MVIVVLCGWCGYWCCVGGVVTGVVWVVWSLVLCGWCVQDVMKYELLGDARALEYYYLNPETGVISLKKLLTQGSQVSDTVSQAQHVSACTSQTQAIKRNMPVHAILRHGQ